MKTKALTSMNISIPAALREKLEQKLARHAYGSASEYVRQLIRQDLERDAREKVEALLLAGVRSKKRIKVTPEWWREKEAMIRPSVRREAKRA
jgi:antitoxin ParD1/3/4